MASDIVLTSSLRENLLSIKQTQRRLDEVTLRLATGKSVNSALDNPQNFFAAQSLDNRSADLLRLLDGLGQSIRTVQTAEAGIEALTGLVEQGQAVAQEALELTRQSPTEARVVGDKDLRTPGDLTNLAAINNGDQIQFTFRDKDTIEYLPAQQSVTINTGDTIDQLVAEINALNTGFTEDFINASATQGGQLEIRGLNDNILNIEFSSAGGAVGDHLNLATELGFGDQAQVLSSGGFGSATPEVHFTIVPTREISSFRLLNTTTGEVAQRSDRIVDLNGEGGLALFFVLGQPADEFRFGVNGGNVQTVSLDSNQTIQGIIDTINANSLGNLLEADFDEDEGRIILRAIDDSVESIETSLNSDGIAISFFGFNTSAPIYINSEDTDSIRLGSVSGPAAKTIEQLEDDYDNIKDQIDGIVQDANYRGINLLRGELLISVFDEDAQNTLITNGRDFTASGLGLEDADFSSLAQATKIETQARLSLDKIRDFGQSIANDLSIIQTRQDFTERTINTLDAGSDDLTLSDANEDGAELLAVRTRQALGIGVLSFLGGQNNLILNLF